MQVSGLTLWIGERLMVLKVLPAWLIVMLVAIFVSFLTEVTSNSAVINVVTPILIAMVALAVSVLLSNRFIYILCLSLHIGKGCNESLTHR